MSDSEPIEIVLQLSSEYWDAAPKAQVYLDHILLFDGAITQPVDITWSNELTSGPHEIMIKMYGKDKYQTKMENGKIIKDQIINIDQIMFDGIDIGFLKQTLSRYYPSEPFDAPKELLKCINLGYNGNWQLPFSTPIYIWLLENL